MTPLTEQQKSDNVAAVKAYLEGRPIEVTNLDGRVNCWLEASAPTWNFAICLYRPAPVPVTRWWNRPEDVPLGARIRKESTGASLIIAAGPGGFSYLGTNGATDRVWSELSDESFQYSLDRKEWLACTVTEEAK